MKHERLVVVERLSAGTSAGEAAARMGRERSNWAGCILPACKARHTPQNVVRPVEHICRRDQPNGLDNVPGTHLQP